MESNESFETGIPVKCRKRRAIVMSGCYTEGDSLFVVSRLPPFIDVNKMTFPLSVMRSHDEEVDESGLVTEGPLRLKITDSDQKCLIGKIDSLDCNPFFVCIDHASYSEVIPIDSWVTYQQQAGELRLNPDARKKAREDNAAALRNKMSSTDGFTDDLGFEKDERRRMKRLKDSGDFNDKKDKMTILGSALSVGRIEKAAIDWDFDECDATDDEEVNISDADDGEHKEQLSELEHSDDDKDLSLGGKQMSILLTDQKEKEADAELAEVSDLEIDEEEEPKETEETAVPQSHKFIPKQQHVNYPPTGDKSMSQNNNFSNSPWSSMYGTALTPPGSTLLQQPNPRLQPVHPSVISQVTPDGMAVGTQTLNNRMADSQGAAMGPRPESQIISGMPVNAIGEMKQALLSLLIRNSGRMKLRKLISELKIKSKNPRYAVFQQLLKEMCTIDQSEENENYVDLKEKYRAS